MNQLIIYSGMKFLKAFFENLLAAFLFFLAILIFAMTIIALFSGCSTLDGIVSSTGAYYDHHASPYPDLNAVQFTHNHTEVISANGLSDARLQYIDDAIAWCIAQGLKSEPQLILIYVKEPDATDANGVHWINDGGKLIGGKVITFVPPTILVMPEQLGCIRHELAHVFLFQTTGDSDPNHTNKSIWSTWPSYDNT